MAGKRQRSNGTWEFQFERKGLLPRTYRTFENEAEGDAYAVQMEYLLDQGIVPVELTSAKLGTVAALLDLYELREKLAPSSAQLLPTLHATIGTVKVSAINNAWLDIWIITMQAKLSPGTIKKRVELLARCVDWAMRKSLVGLAKNPMRQLPRGYAGKAERHEAWTGQRDRRLSEDGLEEGAIRKVLVKKEEQLLFDMALESAMRLREMYTLTREQVSLERNTIFLEKTKNGNKRQVPMSSVLKKLLTEHLSTLEGNTVFPWWDGVTLEHTYLDNLSSKLSQKFARRFAEAKYPDLHFHDLRHEATSRIYERTKLSDLQVAAITGHSDPRMLARYANLRGSDLSRALW